MKPMKIIFDTREQLPLYELGPKVRATKLEVGDYTTERLINKYHIERKSPQDLYGSIIQGHDRFKRMLLLAKELGIQLSIYVECPEATFFNKEFARAKQLQVSGEQLRKMLTTMKERYDFDIVWCNGREDMMEQVARRFRLKELENGKDSRN